MGDSLVFFKEKREDCMQIQNCLHTYERASGHIINFDKYALTVSPSTHSHVIDDIKNILSISIVQSHEVYLGLPTFSLRQKNLQFDYLRQRICKKKLCWNSKFFSMGGREIWIKSAVQAVPSYATSCFKLPISLCQIIEQTLAKF